MRSIRGDRVAIRAVFVGINKHLDPRASELGGACRDAKALWALFMDSVPGLASRLLLDEKATYLAVSEAIFGTLAEAAADDVVVITFAGHGSPDGHLVLHDTNGNDLPHSGIPMAQIAEAFRTTRAKTVLCILDCCFSGQAPARVLEAPALSRSAFTLAGVHGEGRILISACDTNQPAYEQPSTGHGLLTYAVIQAFTKTGAESISFPSVADDIINLARTEGERIGVTQTPVFLGSVTGGLTFPCFVRGENYRAAFPDREIQRISGKFEELSASGFPPEVLNQWANRFRNGLNDLQLKAVNEHGVLNGKSLLVVAPTSSGKTMIGELAALQAVMEGKKAAFLLPYKAIVNEKFMEFQEHYGSIGLRVVRCSGDASDSIPDVLSGRYDLGFFTYETFLNLALGSPRLLRQLGLVVVDEAQFITNPHRGITVELILSLLLRCREQGITPQLVLLSAVLGNLNEFDRWLGLEVLLSRRRPVPLIEGVLDRAGAFQFLDEHGVSKIENLLQPWDIHQRKGKQSSQDVIVPLAKRLVAQQEKLLVFRNARGPAQGCGKYLADELGLSPALKVLEELPNHDLSEASRDLRHCLMGGTAFHNTNLLRAEREAVERGFRNPAGEIHVIAATTTLAAGINTPASTVILAETSFPGEDQQPFTVAEYKNMAGRAGRLGLNEIGKSIILADTPMERARLFAAYVLGEPEPVESSFQDEDLPTWTLRLLSQVRGARAADIPRLLVSTFGGFIATRRNSRWVPHLEEQLRHFVERLLKAGLAAQEGDLIHLTMLGSACGASSLSFESALRLVELLKQMDVVRTPAVHVVGLVQALKEMDNTYTPLMTRGQAESLRPSEVAQRYGRELLEDLQRYGPSQEQFRRRCKRAAILFDWLEGVPIEDIERAYSPNPYQGVIGFGDIIKIADATRFHLRSAHRVLAVLFPEHPALLTQLDDLLVRLEFGLPQGALLLRELPVPLERGQYLALFRAGVISAEQVHTLPEDRLASLLGQEIANRIRRTRL